VGPFWRNQSVDWGRIRRKKEVACSVIGTSREVMEEMGGWGPKWKKSENCQKEERIITNQLQGTRRSVGERTHWPEEELDSQRPGIAIHRKSDPSLSGGGIQSQDKGR